MAEGVVHHVDADHGAGIVRADRDGELLPFEVEAATREHRPTMDIGTRVRFDVAVGQTGKQAVHVIPV